MASAGTVTLDLDANSVKLLRELQKAERSTKKSVSSMSADFSRMASNIAKTTAVVATAFAAMTAKITRDGLKVIDANAKMARSLNASNDALKALQMAAGDAGLDGLEGSLSRMTRALGAAEMGTGRAVKTIEVLGLDLAALSQMDVDQKLQTIGQAIRDAGISSEQASRHLQNLGFDQAQAMQFFTSGITDLSHYRREINALGLSLSSFDAARVERANDAMGVFGDVIQGISQRVAVNMSDILFYFSQAFTDMAVNSDNLGDHVDHVFQKIVFGALDLYETVANAVTPVFRIVKTFYDDYRSLPTFVQELGLIGALLFGRKGLLAIVAFNAAMTPIKNFFQYMEDQIGASTEGSDLAGLNDLLSGRSDFSVIDSTASLFDPSFEAGTNYQAAWLRDQYVRMIEEREQFRKKFESVVTGTPVFINADDLEEEFVAVQQFTEKAESQLNQFAQQAANNMQSAFANFLFDPFKEGLRGMLSGLIDTIRRMMAEIAAQKILAAIFGGLANAPSAFISSLGRSFGGQTNIVGPMPSRDSGGRGVAGQPYMIGRGAQPEVFIPDSAGTFIPNADQMGGATFHISVDARDAGAEARIRDMINQEMAPQIIAAAKGSTMAAMRRPRFA
jgi:hypothetical protein